VNPRLARLVESGILVKVPYSQHPPRYDYRLTDKGRDLWPVLTSMRQWGDKHAAPDCPPVPIRHSSCGQISTAVMTCSACREPVDAGDLRAVAGPGDLDGLAITGGHPDR
jgi:hypothetical protein